MMADKLLQTIRRLGDPQQRAFFFQGLTNPKLFESLVEIDTFANPPGIITDSGNPIHPIWPEARYLVNVADKIPQKVADLIRSIHTTNRSVVADLVQAVSRMPLDVSAALTKRLIRWFNSAGSEHVAPAYVAIIEKFAASGYISSATRLASAVLGVVPGSDSGLVGIFKGVDAVGRIDDSHYPHTLDKIVRALLPVEPIRTLRLIAYRLNDALTIEEGRDRHRDYSSIWAKDLSKNPIGWGIKETLTYSLYVNASKAIAGGSATMGAVANMLGRFNFDAFRRIALAMVLQFGSPQDALQKIEASDFFDDPEIAGERASVLRKFFPDFDDDVRAVMLTRIHQSVTPGDWLRELLSDRLVGAELDAAIEHARASELFEALEPIAQHLVGADASEFNNLRERFRPNDEEPKDEISGGPTSPKSIDELDSMPTAAIIEFVNSWTPRAGLLESSPEGLGRILGPIVTKRGDEFLIHNDRILRWPPVYVKHVIGALRLEAASKHINLSQFVGLLDYARLRQADAAAGKFDSLDAIDSEPSWSPLRQMVAFAVSDLCRAKALSLEYRERVWAILEAITDDKDPTPQDEARLERTKPWGLALNSARGAGMLAVFDFARWLYALKRVGAAELDLLPEAPELFELLDKRLDPSIEPTLAVRSTYGQNFVSVYAMSRTWMKAAITKIFSPDASGRAAWDAYLIFNDVYEETFELLKGWYEETVASILTREGAQEEDFSPLNAVGRHLTKMYGRGKLDLLDDSLAKRFFRDAPSSGLKASIEFIGNSLARESGLSGLVLQRFKELYDLVLDIYQSRPLVDRRRALSGFGLWFIAPQMDREWLLRRLVETLKLTKGQVSLEFKVLELLATISADDPYHTVDALSEMQQNEFWLPFINSDAVRTLLTNAVHAGGEAASVAVRVHDRLVNNGIFAYMNVFR